MKERGYVSCIDSRGFEEALEASPSQLKLKKQEVRRLRQTGAIQYASKCNELQLLRLHGVSHQENTEKIVKRKYTPIGLSKGHVSERVCLCLHA